MALPTLLRSRNGSHNGDRAQVCRSHAACPPHRLPGTVSALCFVSQGSSASLDRHQPSPLLGGAAPSDCRLRVYNPQELHRLDPCPSLGRRFPLRVAMAETLFHASAYVFNEDTAMSTMGHTSDFAISHTPLRQWHTSRHQLSTSTPRRLLAHLSTMSDIVASSSHGKTSLSLDQHAVTCAFVCVGPQGRVHSPLIIPLLSQWPMLHSTTPPVASITLPPAQINWVNLLPGRATARHLPQRLQLNRDRRVPDPQTMLVDFPLLAQRLATLHCSDSGSSAAPHVSHLGRRG